MKKDKKKKAAAIILLCVLFAGVYFAVMSFEAASGYKNSVIMQIYACLDALLIFLYIVLNLGFSGEKASADMFGPTVEPEAAQKRADLINRNKRIAAGLLYVILPLTFTLLADIVILFWGDAVLSLFRG